MFNSKLKLQGLSLEEIIHEGVHGNNPEVSVDDWKFIESLVAEEERDCSDHCNCEDGKEELTCQIKYLEGLLEENDIEY